MSASNVSGGCNVVSSGAIGILVLIAATSADKFSIAVITAERSGGTVSAVCGVGGWGGVCGCGLWWWWSTSLSAVRASAWLSIAVAAVSAKLCNSSVVCASLAERPNKFRVLSNPLRTSLMSGVLLMGELVFEVWVVFVCLVC